MTVSCAKSAEPIDMQFTMATGLKLGKIVFDAGQDYPTGRGTINTANTPPAPLESIGNVGHDGLQQLHQLRCCFACGFGWAQESTC